MCVVFASKIKHDLSGFKVSTDLAGLKKTVLQMGHGEIAALLRL